MFLLRSRDPLRTGLGDINSRGSCGDKIDTGRVDNEEMRHPRAHASQVSPNLFFAVDLSFDNFTLTRWEGENSINLKYEAISVPQGSDRLVKKTQERKSSTCYLLITKGVTSSSPVPLKTRRVGERCTLNLSRAQTSSCWSSVVVKRGQLKYRPRHLTMVQNYEVVSKSPRVAEQCDVNIHSLDHESSLKLQ
ncbi:uncharacterized protein TNCV_4834181 [Trichonephila clavipes]|nr:uncharacterized protein TNCV_4834181 [Trichonephila clavipes]